MEIVTMSQQLAVPHGDQTLEKRKHTGLMPIMSAMQGICNPASGHNVTKGT